MILSMFNMLLNKGNPTPASRTLGGHVQITARTSLSLEPNDLDKTAAGVFKAGTKHNPCKKPHSQKPLLAKALAQAALQKVQTRCCPNFSIGDGGILQ